MNLNAYCLLVKSLGRDEKRMLVHYDQEINIYLNLTLNLKMNVDAMLNWWKKIEFERVLIKSCRRKTGNDASLTGEDV